MLRGWDEGERRRLTTEVAEGPQGARRRVSQKLACATGVPLAGREFAGWKPALLAAGLGLGNLDEDGLVRGLGFVMIWMFLVGRGTSAASCS